MDKIELMLEAERRGILPASQKAILNEAIKRGIVPPDAIDKSALSAQKPNALERLGRGFADVTQGVTQLGLGVKDAFTGGTEADQYTADKTAELQAYEKGRGPDAGMDFMRLGGNVLATAPAMLIPGAGAAGLGARVASGAAQGAASSAAMFTPEGESKTAQTLTGAALGGALPVAIQGIKAAGRSILDRLRGPAPAVPVNQVEQALTLRLEQQGIDFGKLSQEVKSSLVADAQKALTTGAELSDDALRRKAIIESVGAKPTAASVTRDQKAWQTEQNLRGITGVGEPIAQRAAENSQALTTNLVTQAQQVGGKTNTPYEAAQSIISAVKNRDAADGKIVGDLYDAFKAGGASNAELPSARVADALGRVADEIGAENIPSAVLSRLKEFGFMDGTAKKLFTVNESDKLNRLINNNNPGGGPQAKALKIIKEAVNDALLEVNVPGAADSLLTARAAAAQRFAEQRAGKGIQAIIDGVEPDKFINKFVYNADVKDLKALMTELGKTADGQQGIKNLKGQLFDDLLLKSTGAKSLADIGDGAFSYSRFADALSKIPTEKKALLFTADEMRALRQLEQASKYLTKEVPFSDVNHAKTAAALANLMQKIGNTPFLGKLVAPIIGAGKIGTDWVENANNRKAVAEALLGSAAKPVPRAAIPVTSIEKVLPAMAGAVSAEPRQRLDY